MPTPTTKRTGRVVVAVLFSLTLLLSIMHTQDQPQIAVWNPWSYTVNNNYTTHQTESIAFQVGNGPVGVLLLARWHTGSTFTGSLLSRSDERDTVYFYEPGLKLNIHLNQTSAYKDFPPEVYVDLFSRLYRCDFRKMNFILKRTNKYDTGLLPELSKSSTNGRVSTDQTATEICKSRKYIAIKTIRVPDIALFLPLVQSLNLRIIQLVRDPRAMLASVANSFNERKYRPHRNLLQHLDASMMAYITYYCKFNLENVETAQRKSPLRDGQYMLLRYEDAASDPMAAAVRIHRFLGRKDVPRSVVSWIDKHTTTTKGSDRLTRNSNETYTAWRLKIPYEIAKQVEQLDYCPGMMARMGYYPVTNEEHLQDISGRSLVGQLPDRGELPDYPWSL